MAKKITGIIWGVSWVIWTIFQFTPARDAVPSEHAWIIVVVFMLIAIISATSFITMAVRDHYRRHKGEC